MKRIFYFILILCLAISVDAVTIVQVEGVVTSIEERGGYSFDGSIEVGTAFTETYYFSDIIDSSSDPFVGDYSANNSVTSIGNYIFTSSEVGMSVKCHDYYSANYYGNAIIGSNDTVYIDLFPYEYNSVNWLYSKSFFRLKSSSYRPVSDAFPSSFPDIAVFDLYNYWSLACNVETNDVIPDGIYIDGEITSIEVIPEPCTILLFGLGSIALLRRRR